jgi:hypothetical protein
MDIRITCTLPDSMLDIESEDVEMKHSNDMIFSFNGWIRTLSVNSCNTVNIRK